MTGAPCRDGLGAPEGAEPCGLGASPAIPSASALRKVASQIRHRLSDMELRTNVSAFACPGPKDKASGYIISEVADWQLRQWLHIIENNASAIEARSDATPQSGAAEGESAAPQEDAR